MIITTLLLLLLLIPCSSSLQAGEQRRLVTGTVIHAEYGHYLEGVNIVVSGTSLGTSTDSDGSFRIQLSPGQDVLLFTHVGMQRKEVFVGDRDSLLVLMAAAGYQMDEFVITALGISRERKSLGYAAQEIRGQELQRIPTDNLLANLAGRSAGLQVRNTHNTGGSVNIVMRGHTSLTQNNQALIVVDGVPFNNDMVNSTGQVAGRYGFDYGTAAADLSPFDIESATVLKGSAATALYGARAANGALIITTKKGERAEAGTKPWQVNLHHSLSVGFADKSTFPRYQRAYGAGYGPYYGEHPFAGFERIWDVNGDGQLDYTVPTTEDASMGQAFDPDFYLFQWDAYDPASPNYMTKTPWVAATHGPSYMLENPLKLNTSIDVSGGSDRGTLRASLSNLDQEDLLPNSSLKRNSFFLTGTYDVLDQLRIRAQANYVNMRGQGRNTTGYSDNILSSFRQWKQTNVDFRMLEYLYRNTGRNITWNPNSPFDPSPVYWDNPYFNRHENYQTDERNRLISQFQADWQVSPGLGFMGRAAIDTYHTLHEERKAVGSASEAFGVGLPHITSGYARFNKSFLESNFDLLARFQHQFNENVSLHALAGTNYRYTRHDMVYASTDGGLIVPGLYTLSNSTNPQRNPEERLTEVAVIGLFTNISLGFRDLVYLEGSLRRDRSSTLPADNNTYYYPSLSASWLFSNHLNTNRLQLVKLRLAYARVGMDAPWGSTNDTYTQYPSFGGVPLFSLPEVRPNIELKPETTSSVEAGLELISFNSRLFFDLSVYRNITRDQIMPMAVSSATGYSAKFVNAGEIENKGLELMVSGLALEQAHFRWEIGLNWSANRNQVLSLAEGVDNLQLASHQGGVTINARVGEPYGTIHGTDYIYTNGQKTVGEDGYYLRTGTSDHVLGNVQPDWISGIRNTFSYKNWSAGFLVDWQQGGSVYSLDMHYGLGTGIYEETVFINDLGNPVRDPVSEGGGLILDGVYADGTPNTTRVEGGDYRVFGWVTNPNRAFVYDATFIKLREAHITYAFSKNLLGRMGWIQAASVSITGSNLWIIHKKLPYADPEAGHTGGNITGWQSGVMPTTRSVGMSLRLQF